MARPIIFVDIDGPLIPFRTRFTPRNLKGYNTESARTAQLDETAACLMQRLFTLSNAQCVLSTTWATMHPLEEIRDLFAEFGLTPDFHPDWSTPRKLTSQRTHEITMWLGKHPEVDNWIAIDDDIPKLWKDGRGIQVSFDEGFLFQNYISAGLALGLTFSQLDSLSIRPRDEAPSPSSPSSGAG